ncbi:MAG TPA: translation initiation factor IF-2, partial [Pseudothermotoga sp.]
KRKVRLEELLKMMEESDKKELNIVLKTDTFGSLSAVQNAINSIKSEEIEVKVVHSSVGTINNSDVMLASASNGIIIGFRVKVDPQARKAAENEGVQIKTYEIIYDLLDNLKLALEGMLKPQVVEELIGRGEIKKVFEIKKVGKIAGVQLLDGFVDKNCVVKIYRNGNFVSNDEIESLKHYKQDVDRVDAPQECGIKLKTNLEIKEGDELEFYQKVQIQRKL